MPRVRCSGPALTHQRLGGSKRGCKEKLKQTKSVFISGTSSAPLEPKDQGFSSLGVSTACGRRRYQGALGHRPQQRANRRCAAIAARHVRETATQQRQRQRTRRRQHQSDRQTRRHRSRQAQAQAVECQRLLSKIREQVNPLGGTAKIRTTPSQISSWRSVFDQGQDYDGDSVTTFDPAIRQLIQQCHAVQPEGVADTDISRSSDDGILLIVEGCIFGKTARMLIDSGASQCFVTPGAVFRLGLHSIAELCMLELADGCKIMTNGKVPAALVQIASSSARVDMTVSPLLHAVDVILGVTWLSSVNPLIDWTVPRLIFPDLVGTTTTRGTFLTKEHHVGTVSIISHLCFSSALPSRLLPPQLALLRTPSFWCAILRLLTPGVVLPLRGAWPALPYIRHRIQWNNLQNPSPRSRPCPRFRVAEL